MLALALAASLIGADASTAAEAEEAPSRPRFRDLRQEEDWSALRAGPLAGRDRFDPLKFIALDASGWAWLSLGGQLRERVELWDDFASGEPRDADHDDVFLLSRVLLHADLHLGESLRLFAQAKSAHSTDRDLVGGRRPSDADVLDLQNGFAELALGTRSSGRLVLRAGRQEMNLGRQRLVSALDWANARRTFDGVWAQLERGDWRATAFWTRPLRVRKYEPNDHVSGSEFYGLAATRALLEEQLHVELNWFGLERDDARFNGSAGHENRHSFGARLWGAVADTPLDFDIEAALQRGSLGDQDVSALMLALELGWWLSQSRMSPRFSIGLDHASGDRHPGGDVQTFHQLFPLAHAYYGIIDAVARQNALDLWAAASLRPLAALSAQLSVHRLARARGADGLYDASGALARPPSNGSRHVGTELDAVLSYQVDPHLALQVGYAHLFAGSFLRGSGASRGVDFGYFSATYTF